MQNTSSLSKAILDIGENQKHFIDSLTMALQCLELKKKKDNFFKVALFFVILMVLRRF